MTSRERLLTALDVGIPDRLPVTTHHLMPSFLSQTCGGISALDFFDRYGLDPILWIAAHRPDQGRGHVFSPSQPEPGYLDPRWIESEQWRIEIEPLSDNSCRTDLFRIHTPGGQLQMATRASPETAWVVERLVKEKGDIDLIARYAPAPLCDTEAVNEAAEEFGDQGMVRGTVPGFDIYGQPGCWQDAAVLVGTERLIMETFDDPVWVRTLLDIVRERKLAWIASSAGARFDLLELGGGDASSTVISPDIFESFVAPWDCELIAAAHAVGQRVVYHTCGGMMPLLELIAATEPDAMETFTPPSLGGDVDLARARERLGNRVCMIGGFDQARFFTGCTPAETRRAVRSCFEAAGAQGGYILAPSDHFFEAEPELIEAFADEARSCIYPA